MAARRKNTYRRDIPRERTLSEAQIKTFHKKLRDLHNFLVRNETLIISTGGKEAGYAAKQLLIAIRQF